MAVSKAVLLLLATAVIVSANPKRPIPEFNGCFKGRLDGSINVQAVFDQGGVRGTVQFYQPYPGEPTEINVNLQGLEGYSGSYQWHAHEFPARNALLLDNPCSNAEVGGHYDPFNAISDPDYATNCNPRNRSACEVGDFSGKLGYLANDRVIQSFSDETLDLFGPYSVIGRALVLHYPQDPFDRFICANIEPLGCNVKTLTAVFNNTLEGEVTIRYASGTDSVKISAFLTDIDDTMISTNLSWTIHYGRAGENNSCEGVSDEVAGSGNPEHFLSCAMDRQRLCPFGDLNTKCGDLRVRMTDQYRACCTDTQIGVIPFQTLFDPKKNRFLSVRVSDGMTERCATLVKVSPRVAKVHLNAKDVFGTIYFSQATTLDRTFIRTYISSLRMRDTFLTIRENAVPEDGDCSNAALGDIFQKPGGFVFGRPTSTGLKTGDHFLPGALSSAIPIFMGAQTLSTQTSSHYVPVVGPFSIIGRSLVLTQRRGDGTLVNLACGTIVPGSTNVYGG